MNFLARFIFNLCFQAGQSVLVPGGNYKITTHKQLAFILTRSKRNSVTICRFMGSNI
jgi:hypothetical protein